MNPLYLKSKDTFTQRRTPDNNGFEEYPLIVQPSSIVHTDNQNNLTLSSIDNFSVGTASYAISASHAHITDTASYTITNIITQSVETSSYSISASWASRSLFAGYANNSSASSYASYALTAGSSILSTTASYTPLANRASEASYATYSQQLTRGYPADNVTDSIIGDGFNWVIRSEESIPLYIGNVSGSNGFHGNLFGTASYAISASHATNADTSSTLPIICLAVLTSSAVIATVINDGFFQLSDTPTYKILSYKTVNGHKYYSNEILAGNGNPTLAGEKIRLTLTPSTNSLIEGVLITRAITTSSPFNRYAFIPSSSYAGGNLVWYDRNDITASNDVSYPYVNFRNQGLFDSSSYCYITLGGITTDINRNVAIGNDLFVSKSIYSNYAYTTASWAEDVVFPEICQNSVSSSIVFNTSNLVVSDYLASQIVNYDLYYYTTVAGKRYYSPVYSYPFTIVNNGDSVQLIIDFTSGSNSNTEGIRIVKDYVSGYEITASGVFYDSNNNDNNAPLNTVWDGNILNPTEGFCYKEISNALSFDYDNDDIIWRDLYVSRSIHAEKGFVYSTSSWAIWTVNAVSSSWAKTASYAITNIINTTVASVESASWASQSLSSSFLIYNGSPNGTASYAIEADYLDGHHGQYYQTASNLLSGILSPARLDGHYTITASWADKASWASMSLSSSWASASISASHAITSSWAISASYASSSTSSSYALTAAYAENGGGTVSTKAFIELPVWSAKTYTEDSAIINTTNPQWELRFANDNSAIWQWIMPESYNGTSDLVNTFGFYNSIQETGTQVDWKISISHYNVGGTDNFYTGTPGIPFTNSPATDADPTVFSNEAAGLYMTKTLTIPKSSLTGLVAGSTILYKLERLNTSTATGVMNLVSNIVNFNLA